MSVRSIGTGEIAPSPVAKSGITCFAENEEDSFFVVRSFKSIASKWLKCDATASPKEITAAETKKATAENDTVANRTDSNVSLSEEEEEIVYDLTTDMAYHNSTELEGAEEVRKALTPDEETSMPDAFMPLRHYRAEKVSSKWISLARFCSCVKWFFLMHFLLTHIC